MGVNLNNALRPARIFPSYRTVTSIPPPGKTKPRLSQWGTGLKDWTSFFLMEVIIGCTFPCYLAGRLFREMKTVYESEIDVSWSLSYGPSVVLDSYSWAERCTWGAPRRVGAWGASCVQQDLRHSAPQEISVYMGAECSRKRHKTQCLKSVRKWGERGKTWYAKSETWDVRVESGTGNGIGEMGND